MSERLLRLPEVSQTVGFSRSHLWRLVKQGKFPQPIPLGPNSRGWLESEVQAFIAARVAERNAGTAA